MKRILVIFAILLIGLFAFNCGEKKKPTGPDLEDPNYYYPVNLDYKWTYVHLDIGCVEGDSFVITAIGRNHRSEGTGWDLVSSVGGDTSFRYQLGDTIFYENNVTYFSPSYKILIRPVKTGTFWKDAFDFEYSIVGFEDLYSYIAGMTYQGCAKIRRTRTGDSRVKYLWWAPQYGRVKEVEYADGDTLNCLQGEELKRLDKTQINP